MNGSLLAAQLGNKLFIIRGYRQITCINLNMIYILVSTFNGWLRGTVVERRSLIGELSLSCARPAADW